MLKIRIQSWMNQGYSPLDSGLRKARGTGQQRTLAGCIESFSMEGINTIPIPADFEIDAECLPNPMADELRGV